MSSIREFKKKISKLLQQITVDFREKRRLPLFLLDEYTFSRIFQIKEIKTMVRENNVKDKSKKKNNNGGQSKINKDIVIKTYIWLIEQLKHVVNEDWFTLDNLRKISRRCQLHWKMYNRYLPVFEKVLIHTGLVKISLAMISEKRINVQAKMLTIVNTMDDYNLFSSKLLRMKPKIQDDREDWYTDDQLEIYDNKVVKEQDIEGLRFTTGMGGVTWVNFEGVYLNDYPMWLSGLASVLKTFAATNLDYYNDYFVNNGMVAKLKVYSNEVSGRTHIANYEIKIQLDISSLEYIQKNNVHTIWYEQDNMEIDGSYFPLKRKIETILFDEIFGNAINLVIINDEIATLTKFCLYNIKLVNLAIPDRVVREIKLLQGADTDRSKVVIAANKGAGKTSILSALGEDSKIFIIDSDDWGSWLSHVLSTVGRNQFDNMDDMLTAFDNDTLLIQYTMDWFYLGERPISIFEQFTYNYLDKSDDKLKELLKYIRVQQMRAVDKLRYWYNLEEEILGAWFTGFETLYLRLLNDKYLSLRAFETYLTYLDEYKNANLVLQLVHNPTESNGSLPMKLFLYYRPPWNNWLMYVKRVEKLLAMNVEDIDLIGLKTYIVNKFLAYFYNIGTDFRDVIYLLSHIIMILRKQSSLDSGFLFPVSPIP